MAMKKKKTLVICVHYNTVQIDVAFTKRIHPYMMNIKFSDKSDLLQAASYRKFYYASQICSFE